MRIEELILEGFKSYPVRTTITGWDESFNAITGLNGSGKSNILDAICFVLGITNMTSVRATNLLDLIYKRGQAGVTKASVTIVFSNRDRATSPVGFEDHPTLTVTRQIAVGGITKYMLNGHKTTLVTLQSLFQSVQLNINSPNFLIMQGKITKVLNMKPQEILGMVEEASGTRMFEERKDKAWKTMGKKDKKVAEMEALLKEEITPKLDSLRAEKRAFLAYQKTTTELERLLRLVKAAEWMEAHRRGAKAGELVEAGSNAVKEKKELVRWLEEKKGAMEREVARVLEKRDKEFSKGGKLAKLTEAAKAAELEIEKVRTKAEIVERGIAEEEERAKGLEEAITEIQESRGARAARAAEALSAYDAVKGSLERSTTQLASDEELLQTLLTGLTSSANADDNRSGGYMGQIAAARAALSAGTTEGEQAKLAMGHKETELKTLEPKAKKAAKEGEGLARELEEARKRKAELERILESLGGDEQRERELLERKAQTAQAMNGLLEKRDTLKSRLASTDFTYTDPTANFDRSKVKGLVANLVNLAEKDYASATALEVCAGGKLYNVIVEDEKVASALLGNKNSLRKRVTLLPLNKIQPYNINPEKVNAAKKLAPGRVQTAISLVGYEAEVSAAMAFVFGGAFVCADEDAAKRVTFDKAVMTKSITLAGDVYDPSGTLSGGAAPKGGGVLVQVQAIREVERELAACRRTLAEVDRQLASEQAATDKVRAARRELEVKTHEVGLLEEQVNGSNAARVVADVADLKAAIAEYKQVIAASKDKQKQAKDDIKRLEKDMEDFKKNKDSKLNELKSTIAAQRKALTKQTTTVKAAQKDLQTAQMELEQVDGDVESATAERAEADEGIARSRAEFGEMQKTLAKLEAKSASASADLKQEQAALASFDNELADLERDIKHKKQEASDAELAIKAAEHELQQHVADQKRWAKKIEDLEHQFTWIKDEKRSFGVVGTVYDFTDFDLGTSRNRCAELEDLQKGMKRKVNPKVMNMIDSVEKKEAALKKMMSTVLKDKGKIESTISELDQYKRDALQTTWEKVNADFGAIFAELLPGNFAKLQPPDGMDITEGLEVKIRLGAVWKQSLTELSGGQRSLIALSLIMSLLQFKPAPMYILDEIDAALDLSHTQHIGQLFRNRFKGSQFIVVSLKEGLFTNANVLFKAKFVDGTSTVERTVTRTNNAMYAGRKSLPSAAAAADKENAPARRGAASRKAPVSRAQAVDDDDAEADDTTAGGGESFDLSGVQDSQSQSRARTSRKPLAGR